MNPSLRPALAALRDHRPEDAWTAARTILGKNPNDAFALTLASVSLRLLGRTSTAELLQRRAAAAPLPPFPDGDDIEFMRLLDEFCARTAATADDKLLRARRLVSEGAGFLHSGNYAKADRCFLSAVELDPKCGPAHYHRAVMAAKLGQPSAARACLTRAIQADPDFITARVALNQLNAGKRLPALVSA